jgi:phosphoribosylaminoimidazole-succinocarboxamide synthase
MTTSEVLLRTELPLPLRARGKVRDIYDVGGDLLIVATDRISAFDCVLGSGIPKKGEVLTQLSLFWFGFLGSAIANHVITADASRYPPALREFQAVLRGRSMLVRGLDMIHIECVARGYLSGSGWKEYRDTGSVCGIRLPPGLRESDRLPEPIFTPATKAASGHDENVPFATVAEMLGGVLADRLRATTLDLYRRAAAYAETRGIIIADTKFEFGRSGTDLVLADEVLTPDSSRFWPSDEYRAGGPQPSFDKQYVRDYLESIRWNKQPPAPVLPDSVVERTSAKYIEAYRRLVGREL